MLNPDYRDILSAFSAEGVEYLVVGAYALAAHGHPRATGDIAMRSSIMRTASGALWCGSAPPWMTSSATTSPGPT